MDAYDRYRKQIDRLNRQRARAERDIGSLDRYEHVMKGIKRQLAQIQKDDYSMNSVSKAHLAQLAKLDRLPSIDQERVRSMVEPVQQAMARNLGNFVGTVVPKAVMHGLASQIDASRMLHGIDLNKLMPTVPIIPKLPSLIDMDALRETLQRAAEMAERTTEAAALGDETLEASGYGFADHMWNWRFVASFADVHPRVRDAVVTRRMATLTSSETFETWLAEEIEGSRLLKPRWPVIKQALAAHRRREYVLSTPVLLAQIEGIVGDAMILKNRVVARNGKLFRLDNNGQIELNVKGRPIELKGLHSLVDLSKFADHEALEDAASFLTDSIAPWRNAILHGRNVRYGRAKLSVQVLLMVWLLVVEVRAFEEGGMPSSPAPFRKLPRPTSPD